MAACRTCHAPIMWVTTTLGKAMPVDPHPHHEGNVELIDQGQRARVLGPRKAVEVRASGVLLYRSHWVTCTKPPSRRREQPRR